MKSLTWKKDYSPYLRKPMPPTALPYCIRTLGRMQNQPHHSTRGTFHDDAMLMLFLSGRGVYLVGRTRLKVERGMVGLVLPESPPGLLMADPSDPYDHFFCRFAGMEAMRTARRIVAEQDGESFFHWDRWQEGSDLLRRMLISWRGHITLQPERLSPLEGMLATLLAMLDYPPPLPRTKLTAQNIRTYLQDHLAEPNRLDRMAEHFDVSKSHLCRTARNLIGQTLVQAAEEGKIAWAQVLLLEPSMLVSEVARRVGYVDSFYFSKIFKRHTGLCPTIWRKQHRGDQD